MLKKFLVTILSLAVIFVALAGNSTAIENSNVTDSLSTTGDIPEEFLQEMYGQVDALNAYQAILENFGKNEAGLPIYPEEYAGAYIDSGELIVQLTSLDEIVVQKYTDYVDYSACVKFKKAAHSLNELNSYEAYVVELIKQGFDIVGFGVSEKENKYIIELSADKKSNNSTRTAKSIIPDNMSIEIVYRDKISACAGSTEMKGGYRIVNENNGSGMTVGICGKFKGKNAILTCGHGNEITSGKTNFVSYNNNIIGQVTYQRANTSNGNLSGSSYGDFAIITLNDGVSISNVLGDENNTTILGTCSSIPVGTKIIKYGSVTGTSYGTVVQTSTTEAVEYAGNRIYYVRGLYRSVFKKANNPGVEKLAEHGDSGGPVYSYVQPTGDGYITEAGYYFHGTMTAMCPGDQYGYGPSDLVVFSSPVFFAVDEGFSFEK